MALLLPYMVFQTVVTEQGLQLVKFHSFFYSDSHRHILRKYYDQYLRMTKEQLKGISVKSGLERISELNLHAQIENAKAAKVGRGFAMVSSVQPLEVSVQPLGQGQFHGLFRRKQPVTLGQVFFKEQASPWRPAAT